MERSNSNSGKGNKSMTVLGKALVTSHEDWKMQLEMFKTKHL